MLLHLVRHGAAVQGGAHADVDRPLASAGEHQIETLGRTLARILAEGGRPAAERLAAVRIATSPATRCRASAALLAAALEIPVPQVQVEDDFGLGGQPLRGLQALARGSQAGAWVLVSHEPVLATLCRLVLGGAPRLGMRFDAAACACFELESWPEDGRGTLNWFLAAEQLEKLARA